MKVIKILAVATLFVGTAANATLIDFNDQANGTSITNQYAAQGVTFSTDSGGDVLAAGMSAFVPGFGTPTGALTNSPVGDAGRQTFLNIMFTGPASGVSFLYDNYGSSFASNNINAYDASDVLLETLSSPAGSDFTLMAVTFSSSGISKITIQNPGTGWLFAIDDLSFNESAVPEPASWAMMIGGFALAGGAMRRRKAVVSFA